MALGSKTQYEPRPEQSTELLKELHILTRDGKLNQDTRRKLKQVQHLLGFIEPLLYKSAQSNHDGAVHLIDHGAGKSYLGFLLYDAYFKQGLAKPLVGSVTGIETRTDLVERSLTLAKRFGFNHMRFVNAAIADASHRQSDAHPSASLPLRADIVTALHACDTATDDAIAFGIEHAAQHMVIVPCCQAEVAAHLRAHKPTPQLLKNNPLAELWLRPLHTREFGSQLTNVLRCLQLESAGYDVTVTELVGWEHSMKNELIIASRTTPQSSQSQRLQASKERLIQLLSMSGLSALQSRFLPKGVA